MNDITKDINSKLRPFADDCICYREIKDVEDWIKLQEDTDRIGSWARSWGIRFQPISNLMQITRKLIKKINASYTVELQWLEHLWNHENMFETGIVRGNEC